MTEPCVALLTCDVEVRTAADLGQFDQLVSAIDQETVPCTFFVEYTGEEQIDPARTVERMAKSGAHELGLHIHWRDSYRRGIHGRASSWFLPELDAAIERALKAGAPLPSSFRGGGLCCSSPMLEALHARAFSVDSSVAAGLDEPTGWHQGHRRIAHHAWYFPARGDYVRPALGRQQSVGVLEVPVTRLQPSWRLWRPFTLQPGAPLSGVMIRQAAARPAPIRVVTAITHSWGAGADRGAGFARFIRNVRALIRTLQQHTDGFTTMSAFAAMVNDAGTAGTLRSHRRAVG